MSRQPRREQTDEASNDLSSTADQPTNAGQPASTESPQPISDKLKYAQEKLVRMEEAQKLCFKHQNDFPLLAEELRRLKYSDYEITQLLEPKGARSLPGYLKSEIERQRQYVNFLSPRVKPPETHAAATEQSQQRDEGHAL